MIWDARVVSVYTASVGMTTVNAAGVSEKGNTMNSWPTIQRDHSVENDVNAA